MIDEKLIKKSGLDFFEFSFANFDKVVDFLVGLFEDLGGKRWRIEVEKEVEIFLGDFSLLVEGLVLFIELFDWACLQALTQETSNLLRLIVDKKLLHLHNVPSLPLQNAHNNLQPFTLGIQRTYLRPQLTINITPALIRQSNQPFQLLYRLPHLLDLLLFLLKCHTLYVFVCDSLLVVYWLAY